MVSRWKFFVVQVVNVVTFGNAANCLLVEHKFVWKQRIGKKTSSLTF